MNSRDIDVLNEFVIHSGYCIGCGACAAVADSPIVMRLDDKGKYQATVPELTQGNRDYPYLKICPFSGASENESELAADEFSGKQFKHSEYIGKYLACFAGHVTEGNFRNLGSSGGIGKWLLSELLAKGEVDYVVQVSSADDNTQDSLTYRYRICTEAEQVLSGSKSAYQTVEMSKILGVIRENPGRYVVTAIPCFAKALRLLMKADRVFADRIQFILGMFCGHMKSTRYGEFLGWQLGVSPGELRAIDYRVKQAGHKANDKAIEVKSFTDGFQPVRKLTNELQGGNYNLGFFQYKACDYCDDVVAELGDASIGDAWLPQYVGDNRGTSIVVVRNKKILKLIEDATTQGRLQLDPIPEATVVESQSGGFRQRREGLAYRLYLAKKENSWAPLKRVLPNSTHIDRRRRRVYRLRAELWEKSHELYAKTREKRELQKFTESMEKLVRQYVLACRPSFLKRLLNKLKRIAKRH